MTSTIATMPSSVGSGSTNRRDSPEEDPRGFTAVNITPPHSRGMHAQQVHMDKTNGPPESSATSPDVSPRQSTAGAGRQGNYYVTNAGSHKRRRSLSPGQDMSPPPRYDYYPPKRVDHHQHQQQHQQMAGRALHALDTTNEYYANSAPPGSENTPYAYERSYQHEDSQGQMSPDGHMDEEFSRESTNGFETTKLEDGSEKRQTQSEQRQRKRQFANRVKTGCKTCRGRKKKCDEGRPICTNCLKGGFICQGYDHTRPGNGWSQPGVPKQPILLHSKEEDDDDEQKLPRDDSTPVSGKPPVNDVTQLRMAGDGHDQSRPHYVDSTSPAESRPARSGQQQQQQQQQQQEHQQPPWLSHNQHNQQHPQAPYSPDHLPPLHETRSEAQNQHRSTYSTIPQRDMSRPSNQPHPAPSVSATPGGATWSTPTQQPTNQPSYQPPPQQEQQPQPQQQQQQYGARQAPYPPPIDTTQLSHPAHGRILTANTANTASASYSSYEQKAGSKVFLNEDVERSRMLRGAPYNYFDPTLEAERIRCSNALIRYNKLCKLSGTSKSETQAMLRQVFDPKKDGTYNPPAPCRIEGHLGPGVKVETGFDCTYGYNIRISDNVFIGKNTRIDDSAKVEIGARCWIAANVTILTNDVVKELVQRKGTDGQSNVALQVWVGTEVVVGTGAVILPGVRIGRGCTIEPFAVVKTNLPDFTTVPSPATSAMPTISY